MHKSRNRVWILLMRIVLQDRKNVVCQGLRRGECEFSLTSREFQASKMKITQKRVGKPVTSINIIVTDILTLIECGG